MAVQIVELNSDTLALSLILQYVQVNVETEREIQVNNVMIIMQLSTMGVLTAR